MTERTQKRSSPPFYNDEFIRLLLAGTLISFFVCIFLFGIPMYYGLLPNPVSSSPDVAEESLPAEQPEHFLASTYEQSILPSEKNRFSNNTPILSPSAASMHQPDVRARVVRVVDGDTIIVVIPSFPPIVGNNIAIRLASCDAPELKSKNPQIQLLAQEAKAFTEKLAPPGSIVWLRDIRRDKYFRLLARVESNGIDVADSLLGQGLATPYAGGKKTEEEFTKILSEKVSTPLNYVLTH